MNSDKKPIVWTIAGSDSGGGAGIQADLATMQDLGCHGCSAITTLTAQSSVTVSLIEAVSTDMMLSQLETLACDLPPKAIKIGLLANQQQLELIATWLKKFKVQFPEVMVIVDPVMVASCGDNLNQQSLDFTPFIGVMDLLTPNQTELKALYAATDRPLSETGKDELTLMNQMAITLGNDFQCHLLAKGGDASWQAQHAWDLYLPRKVQGASEEHDNRCFILQSPRIDTCNNHGSGCTLSSAIASFLAQDLVLHDAVVLAKAYVNQGLYACVKVGQGAGYLARKGWPSQLELFPQIIPFESRGLNSTELQFKPVSTPLGIYPVVDNLEVLESLLKAGCKTLQFRLKTDNCKIEQHHLTEIELQVAAAIELGNRYQSQLFINDHWQLALKYHAFGIHLGQEDALKADLSLIAKQGMALGLSSHGYFEALFACQLNPSYIACGHIYPTTTKSMPSAPQGVKKLAWYSQLLKEHFATVAIGGIDMQRLEEVAATGVADVAVVRAVTEAKDPAKAYQMLQHQWQRLTNQESHSTVKEEKNENRPN